MAETELKPNSYRYKKEQAEAANDDKKTEVKKVVKGTVKTKKEPVSRKFAETFLSDDVSNVKNYIFMDVLIPAIKDAIVDMITNGVSMMFYGSTTPRRTNSSRSGGSRIDYAGMSSRSNRPKRSVGQRERYSYDDIIFDTRGDAQEVMDCMFDILEKYQMITIADYYELAGADSVYTDRNYGWYDLSTMAIMRDRDGYKIRLPKAVPLD